MGAMVTWRSRVAARKYPSHVGEHGTAARARRAVRNASSIQDNLPSGRSVPPVCASVWLPTTPPEIEIPPPISAAARPRETSARHRATTEHAQRSYPGRPSGCTSPHTCARNGVTADGPGGAAAVGLCAHKRLAASDEAAHASGSCGDCAGPVADILRAGQAHQRALSGAGMSAVSSHSLSDRARRRAPEACTQKTSP
jgi:hypothetical protein